MNSNFGATSVNDCQGCGPGTKSHHRMVALFFDGHGREPLRQYCIVIPRLRKGISAIGLLTSLPGLLIVVDSWCVVLSVFLNRFG